MPDTTVVVMGVAWPDKLAADYATWIATQHTSEHRRASRLWREIIRLGAMLRQSEAGSLHADQIWGERMLREQEVGGLDDQLDWLEREWERHCESCGVDPYATDGPI